jgi:hypothetical protein
MCHRARMEAAARSEGRMTEARTKADSRKCPPELQSDQGLKPGHDQIEKIEDESQGKQGGGEKTVEG